VDKATVNADRLGVTEASLRTRHEFVMLGNRDRQVLEELIPWIETVSEDLAREFYDHQFSFEPTARFFAEFAAKSGVSSASVRPHLERNQAHYIESLFRGARSGWDVAYFEERLHVGTVHDRIDLPLKWYIGSYCQWRRLLSHALVEHYTGEGSGPARSKVTSPRLGSAAALNKVMEVMESVEKVFNLDLQAIADAFLMSTLESLGLSVSSIEVASGRDRTEYLDMIKRDMDLLGSQAETMAGDVMDTEILDQAVQGPIGEGFAAVARKVRTVAASVAAVNANIGSVAYYAMPLSS